MNNKVWSALTALLVLTMLLTACAGGGAQETTAVEPTDDMGAAPTEEVMVPTEETGAGTGDIDCMGAQSGDTVTMLYQWAGEEESQLNEVLRPLVDACGIVIQPESTRDQALLDTRVQGGNPPDIAFWNVAQLVAYQDQLFAMDELGADMASYADFFLSPGTIEGRWLGLPVKADVKTLIWYSPAVFEAKGYEIPETWEELDALVEEMVANGDTPWSMGFESEGATGWTGTDFIQDILLVTQGPEYVLNIISGEMPYNDAGVREAYEIYGKWAKDEKYTVGGAQGTLSTPFREAIFKVFSDPPEAMMVKQSGFAGAEIMAEYPDLEAGTDFDSFFIPGAQGLQGGFDWLMAFSDKPAVKAVVTYLSSATGGANWAAADFGLSPNNGAAGNYTDPSLAAKGEALLNTQGFTPDIGDSIPGGFGQAEFTNITNFVNGEELDSVLDAIAQAQAEALQK